MGQDLRKPDASRAGERPGQITGAPPAPAPPNGALRLVRRVAVAVIGGTVVAVGAVMIVTPGPAIVMIPAGLAILAVEFECARRWLRALRARAERISGSAGRQHPLKRSKSH